jgi:hypothetical protein
LVKVDPQIKKPFAFVCFENNEMAEKAFTYLENTNIFGSTDPKDKIYINWA